MSYNKKAEKLCDLVGNPRKIIDKLKSLNEKLCNGEISIQNSLELAIKTLKLEYFSLKKTILFNNRFMIIKKAFEKSYEP